MYVHYMHAWCLQGPEKVMRSFGTRVVVHFELVYRSWESNLGLLQELQVLITTQSSLQPHRFSVLAPSLSRLGLGNRSQ